MPVWRLELFGTGNISRSDLGRVRMPDSWWPIVGCLVASNGHYTTRGRLAAQLWPEKNEQAARHCLATALWRIRAKFAARSSPIIASDERICLSKTCRTWIDVIVFEIRANAALANPSILAKTSERKRLAKGLALYAGDLLSECEQEWIALERDRLRALYLDASYELALAQADAEEWPAARQTAQTICTVEPLREDARRLLIRANVNCGNRALAIQQYRDFERLLASELNLIPMSQTIELVHSIIGYPVPASDLGSIPALADYRSVLLRTRDEIERTLKMVEYTLAR